MGKKYILFRLNGNVVAKKLNKQKRMPLNSLAMEVSVVEGRDG